MLIASSNCDSVIIELYDDSGDQATLALMMVYGECVTARSSELSSDWTNLIAVCMSSALMIGVPLRSIVNIVFLLCCVVVMLSLYAPLVESATTDPNNACRSAARVLNSSYMPMIGIIITGTSSITSQFIEGMDGCEDQRSAASMLQQMVSQDPQAAP